MVYLLYRDMDHIHNQHKNILDYYTPFSYPLNVFSVQAMGSHFHILTDIVFYHCMPLGIGNFLRPSYGA